ncbi:MAG: polysaccharide biosynthesis tyrosine autokinase [Actinomycetota bacterium]|nr:polysaccharide biosynthesis tyrosine autokinase [Actinomycetota bacterium]
MPPEDDTERTSQPDVPDGKSALWRRRWIVLAVAVFVMAVAVGASFLQTPVYRATANVLVEVPPQGNVPSDPNMDTEKKLVSSAQVTSLVISLEHLKTSPQVLLSGLGVDVPVNTSILEISYTDRDLEQARRIAQAFAEGYLGFRRQQLLQAVQAKRTSLESQVVDVSRRLKVVTAQLNSAVSNGDEVILASEASALITERSTLLQQLQLLPPEATISAGEVVQPATMPSSPASPNRVVDGALGFLLGLLFGIGIAVLLDRRDDRIRQPEEVAAILGARVLGFIPPQPKGRHHPAASVAARPDAATVEAFRGFRADFLLATSQRPAKSILVTSSRSADGKTLTVAKLGQVLAASGKQVILVSGDLRVPLLEDLFGQDSFPGLTDVLSGDVTLADVVREVGTGLRLVPAGSFPDDPLRALGSAELADSIARMTRSADFVLIDSPPLLAVADARVLVPACDAVLFVADARSSTRADLSEARQELEWANAELLGVVMMNVQPDPTRSYPSHPDRPRSGAARDAARSNW